MSKFKVWLRPAGSDCKIRVEGPENVRLLRDRLQTKGITTSEPIQLGSSKHCILHAHCPPQIMEEGLQIYIGGISEVELMLDPA